MTSYLTSILTTTTSRYTSLKQSLLPNESDGDTEDDSHISRVLRAYYTEKGRPFPQWLPPDPKAPQPPPPQPMYLNNPAGASAGRGAAPAGRGGVLSDLWDSPAQGGPPQQEESLSLRRGGRGPGRMQNLPSPGPPSGGIVDSYTNARPLPSQRAGSYQSQFSQQSSASQVREQDNYSPPPSSGGSGVTAQERLKARLWGSGNAAGRSGSPTGSQSTPGAGSAKPSQSTFSLPTSLSPRRTPASSTGSSQSVFSPPPSQPSGRAPVGYDRPGPGAGGGSGYSSRSYSGGNSGDSGDNYKPYVGSSAPWSTGEEEYSGGSGGRRLGVGGGRGYGDQGGSDGGSNGRGPGGGSRGMGMYNGRVVGLPSGPRYK
jgi:Sec1-binding region of Mso1